MKNIRRYAFFFALAVVLTFALSSCASQSPNAPKKSTGYQKKRQNLPQWNTTKNTTTKYVIKNKGQKKSKNPQY